jgi:hypothetical protein
MIGAILFPAGVAVVPLKGEAFAAAPIGGSLIVVVAMALFTVIVFRTSRGCYRPLSPVPGGKHCVSPRRHLLSPSMA